MLNKFKAVFKSKNAVLMLFASITSNFGDWFYFTAMSAILVKSEHYSVLAFISSLRFACMIFLMPIGGAIVEHFPKKFVMVLSDFIRFFSVAGLAILVSSPNLNIVLLIILSSIGTFASIFFTPARRALLPKTVAEEQRTALNALDGTVGTLTLTLAPALGGLLLIYFDSALVIFLDAVSYLISALLILFLRETATESVVNPQPVKESIFSNLLHETAEGFKFILNNILVSKTTLLAFVSHFAVGATWIFVPKVVVTLGLSDSFIGFISSVIGFGSVVGMLIGGSVKMENQQKVSVLAITALSFTMAFWSLGSSHLISTFLVGFSLGLFANIFEAPCWSLLQKYTPENLYSRVFSAFDAFALLGMALGTNLSAFFLGYVKIENAIFFLGLIMIALTAGSIVIGLKINKSNKVPEKNGGLYESI